MSKVIMLCGFAASGKSSLANKYITQGYEVISRDKNGGLLQDMLPIMENLIKDNKNVILDGTFLTQDSRKPFINLATKHGIEIDCEFMMTSTEDCQINALNRMYDRYAEMFMTAEDIKAHPQASKDPNMFPIVVLFKMKKQLQKPNKVEGFANVIKNKFVRRYDDSLTQKALFLDYDGTVREVPDDAPYKFPIKKEEVLVFDNCAKIIKEYIAKGYKVYGASNQSGIARNGISAEAVDECFEETNKQLGIDIEVGYCSHNVPPKCYCRKPQAGLVMKFARRDSLDIKNSIFVGDQTSDKTTATRLGMKFIHAVDFFNLEK